MNVLYNIGRCAATIACGIIFLLFFSEPKEAIEKSPRSRRPRASNNGEIDTHFG